VTKDSRFDFNKSGTQYKNTKLFIMIYHFGLKPLILFPVYLLQAFSRLTSDMFARVQSHAKTSANSSSMFFWLFDASAVASSPTSSMNHMKVRGVPLSRSLFSYFSEIKR